MDDLREQRDAERALTKLLGAVGDGTYVEPSKATVTSFLRDDWLPSIARTVKATTLRSYETHIDFHIAPHIGSIPLQRLSGSDLNALYHHLLTEGREDGTGLSPSSVRRVHTVLSRALKNAVKWRKIQRSPVEDCDSPKLRADDLREAPFWDEREQQEFLTFAEEHDADLFALWRLLLATGLRRGEALALRWSDINFDDGALTVARSHVQVSYQVRESTPKNGKTRRVDLDPTTVSILKAHRGRQLERPVVTIDARRAYVFDAADGSPLHPDHVSKRFKKLVRASGLHSLSIHGLRHSHTAYLASKGAPPNVIQVRLGHHSAAFTLDRYGHLFDGGQGVTVELVSKALG